MLLSDAASLLRLGSSVPGREASDGKNVLLVPPLLEVSNHMLGSA
jgi:hypothetical protein